MAEGPIWHRKSCLVLSARFPFVNWRSCPVFEGRTSTGSEPFSLFICLDANKFVLLSFFSLMKRIYPRVSNKPLPNDAKGRLPVDVRRSTTLLLKLSNRTERERQLTTTRANQTTGLTNGRAASWAPEVVFSPFRALSRSQLTLLFCCKIILMFRWEDSLFSCVDGSPDERAIRVKTIYKCAFKKFLMWTWLFMIVSIYKYDQNHSVFFISFIFNSVNSEALICIRKPNSVGF